MDDVRRSLLLTHTIWGGRFNPLIPVGAGINAERLLRQFRVDVLYPASEVPELTTFAESFPYLRWPLHHHHRDPEFFSETSAGLRTPFLDILHPVLRLHDEYVKGEAKPSIHATLFSWEPSDPLAEVFLAQFGSYPGAKDIKVDISRFVVENLNGKNVSLAVADSVPADAFEALTPSFLTAFDLEDDRFNDLEGGFYVGQANSFEDFINFWNLRAADVDVFFYDAGHEKRLASFRDAFIEAIRRRSRTLRNFPPFVRIWSREGVPTIDTKPFGHAISGDTIRDGLPGLVVPLMQFRSRRALGHASEVNGGSRITFQLPEKPFREDDVSFQQMMVVGIRSTLGFQSNMGRTLVTPCLPEMNDFYRREMVLIGDEVRVQKGGFDILASADSSDMSFYALETTKVIAEFFTVFGIHAEPSLAGRIAMRIIHQMNGVQGCRVFKLPGVRKLIEEYGPLQTFTRGAATQMIAQVDPTTGRPTLPDLFVEGIRLTPNSAFDFLLKRGALRAGLELNCPNCNLEFWLTLEILGHKVVCEYCGESFDVSTQLKDRDWRFRRSGLFGKDNHQEGALPVVLTLQQLDTNVHSLSSSSLLATSFKLSSAGAKISPCETDIVMLTEDRDGRIQLAIGECKTGGSRFEITEQDVKNLLAVANAFPPERVAVFLIFSKTGPFSEAEIARCKAAQDMRERRVILLSDRELEPYHVYDQTAQQFNVDATAISLADLATATHDIFFQPRVKPLGAITASAPSTTAQSAPGTQDKPEQPN
jgi:hypothetical protein